MPVTVKGVEMYVRKLYEKRSSLLRDIDLQIRAALGHEASVHLRKEIVEFGLASQDLGSMRRLLGDLRAAEARRDSEP